MHKLCKNCMFFMPDTEYSDHSDPNRQIEQGICMHGSGISKQVINPVTGVEIIERMRAIHNRREGPIVSFFFRFCGPSGRFYKHGEL